LNASHDGIAARVAADHCTERIPRTGPSETVGDIRDQLATSGPYDSMADVAVVEERRLVGIIPIERLFAAPPEVVASQVMDLDPPVIASDVDQEAVAVKAADNDETSLGVVDEAGVFLGFVPPQRMLSVLNDEHREDMARISGYLHRSDAARSVSEEPLVRRFWHRFPWLLVGLAAAMAAAAIIAGFEEGLAARLELAFFIPGIIYIADAVGTQTETLLVRGLSVGVPVGDVMGRELLTGVVLGVVLGGFAYPLILPWVDASVALTVGLSIFAASAVSTAVAMILPWLLDRMNIDPAFGSGPLSTVIQDLLSLTIYLSLATALVL
jgi:magnesium transporter